MDQMMTGLVALVAAEVAREGASEFAQKCWSVLRMQWEKHFGSGLSADELTPPAVQELIEADYVVSRLLQELLGESTLMRRIARVPEALQGAAILWVDDHPEWNRWETRCLELCGATVRTVETTRSAVHLVGDGHDLVITDIARGDDHRAGIEALPQLRAAAPDVPVVFYVGKSSRGVPHGAFGLTTRPDELIHLVLDAMERSRL